MKIETLWFAFSFIFIALAVASIAINSAAWAGLIACSTVYCVGAHLLSEIKRR